MRIFAGASAPEVPQRLEAARPVCGRCSAKALLHPKSLAWTAEGGCPHVVRDTKSRSEADKPASLGENYVIKLTYRCRRRPGRHAARGRCCRRSTRPAPARLVLWATLPVLFGRRQRFAPACDRLRGSRHRLQSGIVGRAARLHLLDHALRADRWEPAVARARSGVMSARPTPQRGLPVLASEVSLPALSRLPIASRVTGVTTSCRRA